MANWASSYDAQVKSEAFVSSIGFQHKTPKPLLSHSDSNHIAEGLLLDSDSTFGNTMKPAHSFTTNTPPPQHSFGTSQRTGFGKVRGNMGHDGSSISHTTNGQLVNEVAAALEQQTISRHNTYIPHARTSRENIGGDEQQRGFLRNLPENNHQNWSIDLPPQSRDLKVDEAEKPMTAEEIALLNKFLHRTVDMMRNESLDVSKQQMDPKSPLHSVLNFRDLRIQPDLLKALDLMGFQQPSKIQEFALPLLLMEPPTNMIAQSQSGTGKTAAFVLTMLSRLNSENRWPQCLCLAPTYELAIQIGEVLTKMARFMPDVKVHYAVKGIKPTRGKALTEQIIIGTPGKVMDYLGKMRAFDPSRIICLVLDEADVMISQQGHLDLSIRIYNEIEAASPRVQTMLFSATYDQPVIEFAEKLIKDAVSVTLKREDQSLPNIKQYYVESANRDAKYQAVVNLYSGLTIASCVIFTHTRSSASWLAERMRLKGHEVGLLHGDMPVYDRAHTIEQFKDGIYKVLITTNVCARGIDVSQVSIVINYDPPVYYDRPNEPDYETYLHRIGRTGRFGKAGIAINFIDSKESLELIKKVEAFFGQPIVKLDPSDIDQLESIEKD